MLFLDLQDQVYCIMCRNSAVAAFLLFLNLTRNGTLLLYEY